MRRVYLSGIGMMPFGRHLKRTLRDLAQEAARAALSDAEAEPSSVDAVVFANAAAGVTTGQEMIRGQVALRGLGLGGVPIVNVDNACASGSTALHVGWSWVASGLRDRVLVVGSEKLHHQDKQVSFGAIASGTDRLELRLPSVEGGSVMMGSYAAESRRLIDEGRFDVNDLAMVAVKNRRHASWNQFAQYRDPISVEEVLASRQVVDPLTLLMCSPLTDGAAAVLLTADAGGPRIAACELVSFDETVKDPTARAVHRAYESAGIGPGDLDVAEVHDAAAPAELIQYVALGIAAPGDEGKLVSSGATTLGGSIPVNTGGGLMSRGHPLGATGVAQVVELCLQLRGQAEARQVDGARVGVALNCGGWMGDDYAAATATVLMA